MRRSGRLLLAALLLTVPACGGSGDPQSRGSSSPSPSLSPTASPSPAASPSASPEVVDVDAVVTDLLEALGKGESRQAWELLSRPSQESFGSFEQFAQLSSAYAEGFAAFADVQRSRYPLSEQVTLVTLAGEVTREGMTERDAAVLPVRVTAGQARVELSSPMLPGLVQIEVPAPGTRTLAAGTTLRAYVPVQSRPLVLLDGQPIEAEPRGADGDRVQLTVSPELAPGEHVLVVSAVRPDGLVVTAAAAFTVEG